MSLQKHFEDFHNKIKLDQNTQKELRQKRDVLLNILRDSDDIPSFDEYNQGSYIMHLGVEPYGEGTEYDIDVGLRFNVNQSDYEPLELKQAIDELLKDHTDYGSKIKKPCVTVTYKKDGEAAFHVDLVVYTYEDKDDTTSQMYIAMGKESSDQSDIHWDKADPVGLVDYIQDGIDDDDYRKQFRRAVRYLKRWKHIKFSSTGHAEPASIGITLLALEAFKNNQWKKNVNDDLTAIIDTVKHISSQFVRRFDASSGKYYYIIDYSLPSELDFESGINVFGKMTNAQMTTFKEKIDLLLDNLEEVRDEPDEEKQCKKLAKSFGDDFPVPAAKDISKQQHNFIPRSTASGA